MGISTGEEKSMMQPTGNEARAPSLVKQSNSFILRNGARFDGTHLQSQLLKRLR
jgi:hypothetical protein